jgi:hypothetical protein
MKLVGGECEECRVLKEQVKVLTQGLALARKESHHKDEVSRNHAENQRLMLEALQGQIQTRDKAIAELEGQASYA